MLGSKVYDTTPSPQHHSLNATEVEAAAKIVIYEMQRVFKLLVLTQMTVFSEEKNGGGGRYH